MVLLEDRLPVMGLTIDDPHALTYDDAIWVEKTDTGTYAVDITVADVDAHVPKYSSMDGAIHQQLSSRYWQRKNMFPNDFARNTLSLSAGVLRPSLTMRCEIASTGDVLSLEIFESAVRSAENLTLQEVRRVFNGESHEFGHVLLDARDLAYVLYSKRIPKLEPLVRPKNLFSLEQTSATIPVQELMLLFNFKVAQILKEAQLPAPYIYQDFKEKPRSEDSVEDVSSQVRSELGRSLFHHLPRGHVALGVDAYLSVTSPIRFYGDLLAQRILKATLHGEESPYNNREMRRLCGFLNKLYS